MTTKIQESISQLLKLIQQEQSAINQIRPPSESKKNLLKEKLEQYSSLRGRNGYYPYISTGKGNGPFTQLIDDSIKYDLIGGVGVYLLGHSHPLIIESNLEAATSDALICGNLMPYDDSIQMMQTLLDQVKNSNLKHFWYAGSGSFANDLALKLVWQKKCPAHKIIAFKKGFSGRSIGTQDVTDKPAFREGMPELLEVEHVPHYDPSDPQNSLKTTINQLNKVWNESPNQFSAIIMELVQGEGGINVGTKDYYLGVCKWAKEKGLYIVFDEVQTFGRTTELFAFQAFNLDQFADIVVVGKALQCCGILYTAELNPKEGLIAGTFHAAIPCLKAATKTINYLTQNNFYGNSGRIKQLETMFFDKFEKLKNGSCAGKLQSYNGIGTMIAFVVGDGDKNITKQFLLKLMENGVIGFMAGNDPVKVRLLIPLTLTEQHVEEIFSIIEKTILETI